MMTDAAVQPQIACVPCRPVILGTQKEPGGETLTSEAEHRSRAVAFRDSPGRGYSVLGDMSLGLGILASNPSSVTSGKRRNLSAFTSPFVTQETESAVVPGTV